MQNKFLNVIYHNRLVGRLLEKRVFIAERDPFDDSLPDGWGRLLIDRKHPVGGKKGRFDRTPCKRDYERGTDCR